MGEVVISRKDLFMLPEYSCSIPSATTVGKRWKCDVHAYRRPYVPDNQHEWRIGEYVEDPDPNMVGIRWSWAVDENYEPHRGKKK